MIEANDVTVELRLATKPGSRLKAFADVTVALGEAGELTMFGWSVMAEPMQVVPPARMSKSKYFDIILLSGRLKAIVYTKVGMAYKEALKSAAKELA